jgi:uncharacterized protein (TIGR02145 family)
MVTADGGAPVTERGVCWSTSANPSVTGQHSSDGSGLGEFTSNVAGLTVNTTYYVRAYATNSAGTAYGETLSFTPGISCPGTPTVTDYDGNTYNTVQIGTQCWMKENLRTTHYSDGEGIPLGSSTSNTVPYRYYPNNNAENVNDYGHLYNWSAVMNGSQTIDSIPSGVQGICPTGWHVPSQSEFIVLINYLSNNEEYTCNINQENIAKALADTVGWSTYGNASQCYIGSDLSTNNASGFSARGAGQFTSATAIVTYYNEQAIFHTTTTMSAYNFKALLRLSYQQSGVAFITNNAASISSGFSVRCLKD